MEKKIKIEEILRHSRRIAPMVETKFFTWKEVREVLESEKITLNDDDQLFIQYSEGWNEGDSSRDPYYEIIVKRPRLETDEEFEKRKKRVEESKKTSKELRRISYLKLKQEFENE